jgi:RHS repeat-associated protein
VDSGGAAYFGKDVLGSVRTVTGEYGQIEERYEYDAFGKPYQGEFDQGLNLGYTGKPYDTATGLYDYGYRDYAPEAARFTTVDPIRDGTNWFVYVNNDPVNYIDLWGLSASDGGSKLTDVANISVSASGAVAKKAGVYSLQVGADMEGQKQFTDAMHPGLNANVLTEGIYDTVVGVGKVFGGAGIIVASGAGEFLSGGMATPFVISGLLYGGITTIDGWVQASVGITEIVGAFTNTSFANIPKSMSEIIGIVGDNITNAVAGHESKTLQNLGGWIGSQPVGVLELLLNTSPIY